MTTTLEPDSATVAAINERFPDNEAHGQLALMYAASYEENPAAFMGMLMASLHVMHSEVRDVYTFMATIAQTVGPIMENPQAFMDSIEAAVKAKFPALSLMG